MSSIDLTASLVSFLMIAIIAYILFSNCYFRVGCGEPFESPQYYATVPDNTDANTFYESQKNTMAEKGDYTPMEQVSVEEASKEAQGDAQRFQEDSQEPDEPEPDEPETRQPLILGYSDTQSEYASV